MMVAERHCFTAKISKSQFGGLTLKDLLRRGLLVERRRTCKNFDVDAREEQIMIALEHIFALGHLPKPDITKRPVTVKDIYFKLQQDHKAWKRGQGLQPFGPIIEAIRQWLHFIDTSTGQEDIGVHVPGNIGFLAFWANAAKSDTICGIFSVIHDLLQPNLGEAKVRQLMARARQIWIVTIKDSYTKRARVHNNANMPQADATSVKRSGSVAVRYLSRLAQSSRGCATLTAIRRSAEPTT